MSRFSKSKNIISIIALLMAVCLCFAGCGTTDNSSKNNNSNDQSSSTPVVRPSSVSSALNYTQEEVVKMANHSKTVLDLLQALFPDNDVVEDESKGYVFQNQKGITDGSKKVLEVAAKSRYVIEFLEYLYPDRAVYRDDDNGYILEPLRDYLQKNTHNWENTSSDLLGIDVSSHQGTIDWAQVAASDVKFVFIRVGFRGYGDGSIVKDEMFDVNIQGAINSGLPVGVYFASKARNTKEAKEEAEWLIEQIRRYDITWPVAMDIEIMNETDRVSNLDIETRTENVLTAMKIIKDAGYTPMIYSNPKILIPRLDYTKLEEYSKWIAEYQNHPHYPYAFQIWQASEEGQVNGIEGAVDINYSIVDFGASK